MSPFLLSICLITCLPVYILGQLTPLNCTVQLQAQGLRAEVHFGGNHFNDTANGTKTIAAVVRIHETREPCESVTTLPIHTPVLNWAAVQSYYTVDSPQLMEALLSYWADFDEINEDLQGTELQSIEMNHDTDIFCWGSLFICYNTANLTLCPPDTAPIGPELDAEHPFSIHLPIAINTHWTLSDIINVTTVPTDIVISLSIYALKSEPDTDIKAILMSDLFQDIASDDVEYVQNTTSDTSANITVYKESGVMHLKYNNIREVREAFGRPQVWNTTWNKYWYVPDNDDANDVVIYIYSIRAICASEEVCAEWLHPAEDIFRKRWITVAIIFIILTAVAFCVIIFLLGKLGCFAKEATKSGYHTRVEQEAQD